MKNILTCLLILAVLTSCKSDKKTSKDDKGDDKKDSLVVDKDTNKKYDNS